MSITTIRGEVTRILIRHIQHLREALHQAGIIPITATVEGLLGKVSNVRIHRSQLLHGLMMREEAHHLPQVVVVADTRVALAQDRAEGTKFLIEFLNI